MWVFGTRATRPYGAGGRVLAGCSVGVLVGAMVIAVEGDIAVAVHVGSGVFVAMTAAIGVVVGNTVGGGVLVGDSVAVATGTTTVGCSLGVIMAESHG